MKKTPTLLLIAVCLKLSIAFGQGPNLVWAKRIGDASIDYGSFIATDAANNVYTLGHFNNTVDFDPSTTGVHNLTSLGYEDIFLCKLDSGGNFIWARRMGGADNDYSDGKISIDNSCNIYVVGGFYGVADFGATTLTSSGDRDAFITKLDSAGNFIWAKRIGNSLTDWGEGIALDNNTNRVYITGGFAGTLNVGTSTLYSAGQNDMFLVQCDTAGSFLWAINKGGSGDDIGYNISVDAGSNIYVYGDFNNTVNFGGPFTLSPNGYHDIFIAKFTPSSNLIWAKSVGGVGDDWVGSSVFDGFGNLYLTGNFYGTGADFDPSPTGVFYLNSIPNWDTFVLKTDTSGNLGWAESMGGSGNEAGSGITTDVNGNVYICGGFSDTCNFNYNGNYSLVSLGQHDIYIVKLDPSGNFNWVKQMGGSDNEWGISIAHDNTGAIYSTGDFKATANFNISGTAYNLTSAGNNDVFIQKLPSTVTGINELSQSSPIQIYPNPSSGIVNFNFYQKLNKAKIKVYSAFGQIVFQNENINHNSYKLDLTPQVNGIYFATVTTDNEIYTTKIILQR